jgi:NAD(P)-dependent dehydrogenase (short-subunit alcohol dehydrogenase family)
MGQQRGRDALWALRGHAERCLPARDRDESIRSDSRAHVALPHFRRQGSGVLINMASVWGRVSSPQVSAYVTSKFAIRPFSECLRQELADAQDIHVVTILPQAVDTPMWRRAANYSGREYDGCRLRGNPGRSRSGSSGARRIRREKSPTAASGGCSSSPTRSRRRCGKPSRRVCLAGWRLADPSGKQAVQPLRAPSPGSGASGLPDPLARADEARR